MPLPLYPIQRDRDRQVSAPFAPLHPTGAPNIIGLCWGTCGWDRGLFPYNRISTDVTGFHLTRPHRTGAELWAADSRSFRSERGGYCRWHKKRHSASTTTISGLSTFSSALSARRRVWRPGCCPASPLTSRRCVPQSSSSSAAAKSPPRARLVSLPEPRRWSNWRSTKPAA